MASTSLSTFSPYSSNGFPGSYIGRASLRRSKSSIVAPASSAARSASSSARRPVEPSRSVPPMPTTWGFLWVEVIKCTSLKSVDWLDAVEKNLFSAGRFAGQVVVDPDQQPAEKVFLLGHDLCEGAFLYSIPAALHRLA